MALYKLPGRFDSLARISELVGEAGQKAGLSPTAVFEAQAAVDEAFCNIINHAYGGEGRGDVDCTLESVPEGLLIILHDRGKPFHPEEVHAREKPIRLEDVKPGGLGLYFMHKMMDEVHFEFSRNKGNTLKMVKRKENQR